jgi:hypothetical protein
MHDVQFTRKAILAATVLMGRVDECEELRAIAQSQQIHREPVRFDFGSPCSRGSIAGCEVPAADMIGGQESIFLLAELNE